MRRFVVCFTGESFAAKEESAAALSGDQNLGTD
jgi:hypothetical protein